MDSTELDKARARAAEFVSNHAADAAEVLACSGRGYLSSLLRRLPEGAELAYESAMQALPSGRIAAALCAASAAAQSPLSSLTRYADIAMCLGGEAAADALLPLVELATCATSVEREAQILALDLPAHFPCREAIELRGLAAVPHDVPSRSASQLNVEEFRAEFYLVDAAVRIVSAAQEEGWEALEKWRDPRQLCRLAGHRYVPVEIAAEGTHGNEGVREEFVAFQDVIRTMTLAADGSKASDTVYLAQHPLFDYVPALRRDFAVPKWCRANGSGGDPTQINVWIGNTGTGTRLHFDSQDNILVQVVGRKSVTLFDSSQTPKLYAQPGHNFSPCNIDEPDFTAHPTLKDAQATTCVLHAGDALFIPAGMWHWVRATDPSISINFWF